MASEIKLPELGEKVEGGEVVDIKIAVGDEVKEGQGLIEVEAEKSTVEVPSPLAGRVVKLLVKKGDKVKTGQTLALIETRNGKKEEGPRTVPPPREAAAPSSEPKSATTSHPAAAPPPAPGLPADGVRSNAAHEMPVQIVPAGPATRRLARELGVDLAQVRGTARAGRVTQEDIKAYVKQLASGGGARGPSRQAPPLPEFERWGPVERKQLEPIRRRTAEQMSLAWNLIPHVTHHDLADITELEAFRKAQEGKGPKLTVTAFALKAAAIALKQFPHFNATLDEAAGSLILKHYFHIGVAVDTQRGLLVPVLREVDKKSIQDLAAELADIADKARLKKLQADDMRGGTFTITNLGGIGGTAFTPIINYPEVAILGMSRSRWQPVIRDGQVVPRFLLPLSLSYDHRVIDGADAARFTRRLAELLENPMVMLVHA